MTVLKDCRYGPMLFNPDDQYIGKSFHLYGEFSEQEIGPVVSMVPEGGVAVDVGANIGAMTIPLAKRCHSVVAIEPQRVTFQHLCANIALNAVRNVMAIHAGAGDVGGIFKLAQPDFDAPHNNGGYALTESNEGEPTRIITIDSLNLPICHLIKIDVEGMEQKVIEGAIQTIERTRPILYVEADREDRTPALIELLHQLNYRAFWHLPPLFNPNNHAAIELRRLKAAGDPEAQDKKEPENVFPGIVSINLLCAPKEMAGCDGINLPEARAGDTFSILKRRLMEAA
jgi:FkbM family methyltransferase